MLQTKQTLADFPENRFSCVPRYGDEYCHRLACGRVRQHNSTIVIASLARQNASLLPAFIARVERLGEMFADYRVVIYENDSTDGTDEVLRRWAQRNARITYLHERLARTFHGSVRTNDRTSDMAHYRNQYLRLTQQQFGAFDYLAVIDSDLENGWSYDGVAHSIGCNGWDMIGANGIQYNEPFGTYYDTWATRCLSDGPTLEDITRRPLLRGEPLIKVRSCFGGFGLYRMAAVQNAEYAADDCEHPTLHRQLCSNGYHRMFINPSLIAVHTSWWRGAILPRYQFDLASSAERAIAQILCQRRWHYCRVGYDERLMSFGEHGFVEEGAGDCEFTWNVAISGGVPLLTIGGRTAAVTCNLVLSNHGTWTGRWIAHECMPVELTDVSRDRDESLVASQTGETNIEEACE